jgi:hypothetical protein
MSKIYLFIYILIYSHLSYTQIVLPIIEIDFNNRIQNNVNLSEKILTKGNIEYKTDRFGRNCSSGYFNGKDTYLEIPHSNLYKNITTFTLTTWFKIDEPEDAKNWLTLLCKGIYSDETSTNPSFRVQIMQSDKQRTVSINTEFTELDLNFKENILIANKWMHFAIVYDGKVVITYLNGKEIWQYPYVGYFKNNYDPIHIGKDIPGALEYFKGSLDDFKFFNVALNSDQVYSHYLKKTLVNESDLKIVINNVFETNTIEKCGKVIYYDLPDLSTPCNQVYYELMTGQSSGSFFNVGTTSNVYKVSDLTNKEIFYSFDINIVDNQKPHIKCIRDTILYVSSSNFPIESIAPIVYDNCGVKTLLNESLKDNKIYTYGNYPITYKAIDINENFEECKYNLEIKPISISNIEKESNENINESIEETKIIINNVVNSSSPKDSIIFDGTLFFDTKELLIHVYDNRLEDNDTISLFFNGIEIVTKMMVFKKSKESILRIITLEENEENILQVMAWNTGKVGDNTIKIDFFHSKSNISKTKPIRSKVLHSKPGLSSAIYLTYQKNE